MLLGCGVQAFGPLSGINVINYYGPTIYELLGIGTHTSLMITGISGALSIVYCSIGLYLLERIGRVKPLIVSALGLAAALLTNAILAQYRVDSNGSELRAMVAMNFVFSLFYTPLGIISWVVRILKIWHHEQALVSAIIAIVSDTVSYGNRIRQ